MRISSDEGADTAKLSTDLWMNNSHEPTKEGFFRGSSLQGKIPWRASPQSEALDGSSDLGDPQNLSLPPLYPPQRTSSLKYIKVLQCTDCNTLSPNCNEIPPKCPAYRDLGPATRAPPPFRRNQKLGEICQWIGVYGEGVGVTSPGSVCPNCTNLSEQAPPFHTSTRTVRKCVRKREDHPPQGVPTDLYGRFWDDGRR